MQVQQRYMKMHCEHPKADKLQVVKRASTCYMDVSWLGNLGIQVGVETAPPKTNVNRVT